MSTPPFIHVFYDKNKIYIVTAKEWKEYQKLKKYKEEGLIGADFM